MVAASRILTATWARALHFSWGRIIVLLAIVWVVLQVLHMTLLGRLEARTAELQRSRLTKQLHDDSLQLFNTIKGRVEAAQIVDSSGEYKIVNRLYQGKGVGSGVKGALRAGARGGKAVRGSTPRAYGARNDVTLVTQCSVNHMHNLIMLSERWQGPISIAVFAPDRHGLIAIEIIVKLFQCVSAFRENVTVHLVYPFVQAPDLSSPITLPTDFSTCIGLEKDLLAKRESITNYALNGIKYPNNLLRNVALRNSRTKYVFVVDVDMLPSQYLHRDFSMFVERQASTGQLFDDKTAFVVPAFEISSDVTPPADKTDLLHYWEQHKLRPFYSEACSKCHQWTDYDVWRNLTASGLEVGYEVEWRDPWEPFYIAARTMPRYDERFKQYGFNRISQVCELHVAGYKFSVLNNAFLLHRGFKTADGFHASKTAEQDRNRLLFRRYKEELKIKYPDSERRCY